MNSTAWHLSTDTLEDYLGGVAGPVRSASVESHLMACADCRALLASRRRPAEPAAVRAAAVWERIEERIDRRRVPALLGSPWWTTTLSSPALRWSTAALALVLLLVPGIVGALNPRGGLVVLVALAPLAPLIAATLSFRTELDPAGAMSVATPLATGRLTLQRAAVVCAASVVAGAIGSLFVALPLSMVATWLLPGLALCVVVGAAATVVEPVRVAIGLGMGWSALVAAWSVRSRALPPDVALDRLPSSAAATQGLLLLVILSCGAVWFLRRDESPNWRRA
ncbi:MAG: zf-HC2 domain-containing protein [Microthrixaceae bacterium]